MQQIFVNDEINIGETIELAHDQAHHFRDVLRVQNERIRLVYNGQAFFGNCYVKEKKVYVDILEKDENINELPREVVLCMGLIRKEKFELVLQKATELGVTTIIPFTSQHCQTQVRNEKKDKYMKRWNEIVKSASEQCKRNRIPTILEPVSIKDLYDYEADICIIADETMNEERKYLTDILDNQKKLMFLIGPEGGFSQDEIKQLHEHDFQSVSLGSRILRAETAALYVCSILSEHLERSER